MQNAANSFFEVLLNLFITIGTKLQYDFAIEDEIFRDNFPKNKTYVFIKPEGL